MSGRIDKIGRPVELGQGRQTDCRNWCVGRLKNMQMPADSLADTVAVAGDWLGIETKAEQETRQANTDQCECRAKMRRLGKLRWCVLIDGPSLRTPLRDTLM